MQAAAQWQTVEVTGPLRHVAFPVICFRCAGASVRTLRIDRRFDWHGEDGEDGSEVLSLNVPICAACFAQHNAEFRPVPIDKRILQALKTEATIPLVCSGLTELYFLKELALRPSWGLTVIAGLFGLIAIMCLFPILRRLRRFGVAPDTSVSSWIIFGLDRHKLFEPEHRKFQFRNAVFATAFRDANQHKLWSGKSERALNAGLARHILLWAAICVGAVLIVWQVIDDYWPL